MLRTNMMHNKLLMVLISLIDFCFDGGKIDILHLIVMGLVG